MKDHVKNLLAQQPEEVRELALAACKTIRGITPDAVETVHAGFHSISYGITEAITDQFCHVVPKKKRITIGFNHGAELSDPAGLLQSGESDDPIRCVSIESKTQLASGELHELIAEAYRHSLRTPSRQNRPT